VTVFDPDFDVDGVYAQDLVDTLVAALTSASIPRLRPTAQPAAAQEQGVVSPIPRQSKRARNRRSPATT
jgi:arginase